MFPWLLEHFVPLAQSVGQHAAGDTKVYLTARIALAAVTSFVSALILGPHAIRWLGQRFRERIDSASTRLNELHASKQHTPTMGGLFIIAAVVIATLILGDLRNPYVQMALFTAVSFAGLGAADDWIKLSTKRRGLTVRQKLASQFTLAGIVSAWMFAVHKHTPGGLDLIWPFGDYRIGLGLGFIAWAMLVLVGSSNGVNLTDGLDGLAGGCTVFAGVSFVGLTYIANHRVIADYLNIPFMPGTGEIAVVLGALVGAVLGFLWFNCHPAQVFMGDTGALSIGALLGFAALAVRQEVLLVIVGGVFVIETLSVIGQVASRRFTGRKILACSPLHNHFLFKGDHEIKVVTRFWISSALLALIGIASLKIN